MGKTERNEPEGNDTDQHLAELNDALNGGGCTEIWEELSEQRTEDTSSENGG